MLTNEYTGERRYFRWPKVCIGSAGGTSTIRVACTSCDRSGCGPAVMGRNAEFG